MFTDSHCHLNFPELAQRLPDVLAAMQAAQVTRALCISTTMEEFPAVRALAAAHLHIWASVGVHPDSEGVQEPAVADLLAAAALPRVVAVGETGLDYHWCSGDLAWQHNRFITHIQAAKRAQVPLIVHTRDAAADTLRILRETQAEKILIHCFTEDTAFAQAVLNMGGYISFSGILTFKNAKAIQAAAQYCPLDRILVETDSPYLAPVPYRGKENQPAYVRHTAEFLAQLRGDTLENIAAATTANFYRLFDKVQPIKAA